MPDRPALDTPDDVRSVVRQHDQWFRELHISDLGLREKNAFPKVLEAWVTSADIAAASRRRLLLLVGLGGACAGIAGLLVDVIARIWFK